MQIKYNDDEVDKDDHDDINFVGSQHCDDGNYNLYVKYGQTQVMRSICNTSTVVSTNDAQRGTISLQTKTLTASTCTRTLNKNRNNIKQISLGTSSLRTGETVLADSAQPTILKTIEEDHQHQD